MKARGLQDILILCGDGLTGLPNAVESVFPHSEVQLCVVHHIRNVTKFVAWNIRRPLCAAMRSAAALALDRFEQVWGSRYPMSVNGWRQH